MEHHLLLRRQVHVAGEKMVVAVVDFLLPLRKHLVIVKGTRKAKTYEENACGSGSGEGGREEKEERENNFSIFV